MSLSADETLSQQRMYCFRYNGAFKCFVYDKESTWMTHWCGILQALFEGSIQYYTLVDALTWEPRWPQLPPLHERLQQLQHYSRWPLTSGWQKPLLRGHCCCLKMSPRVIVGYRGREFCPMCTRKQKKKRVTNTASLTHNTQGTNSTIVLSWQVLLVAHRAHAISPRVAIETTAISTECRNWALIGFLGHSDVCRLVSWPEDTKKDTCWIDECWGKTPSLKKW